MKAVIDIGTNSIRSLWQETDTGRYHEAIRYTRLGEGATAEGSIQPEALARTSAGVSELFLGLPTQAQADCCLTATSAVREAANRERVCQALEEACGLRLEVLGEGQEAALGYAGATRDFHDLGLLAVLDIGGGSTELTWQSSHLTAHSLPIGAVRLQENPHRYAPLNRWLAPLWEGFPREIGALIGTGGTITTLAAIEKKCRVYDPAQIHRTCLTRSHLKARRDHLAALSPEALRQLPGLPASRADIILSGLDILLAVLENLGQEKTIVSAKDMLHGILALKACPRGLG